MHKRLSSAVLALGCAALVLGGCDRKPASDKPAAAAHSTAPASGATANGAAAVTVFEDWRVVCPAAQDKSCAVQQDVLDAKTHDVMARLGVFRDHGTDVILVTLPFNILLEPGMAYSFDNDKPVLVPFDTCNNVGCISRVPFSGAIASGFAKAAEMRILFAGLDAKPVGLPFSKKGFDAALAEYRREETARGQ